MKHLLWITETIFFQMELLQFVGNLHTVSFVTDSNNR